MTKHVFFVIFGWSVNLVTLPANKSIPEHLHWIKKEIYIGLTGVGKLTIGEKVTNFRFGVIRFIPTKTPHSVTTDKGIGFLTVESPTGPDDTFFAKHDPYPPHPTLSPTSSVGLFFLFYR